MKLIHVQTPLKLKTQRKIVEAITCHGHQYSAHIALFHYHVGKYSVIQADKALVDQGAHSGIVGDNIITLEGNERFADVCGLDRHKVSRLRIATAQKLIQTHGDAIATFHQMAFIGKGHSILSCFQMEDYGAHINDFSSLLPSGKQQILIDGYQIPLDVIGGIPYLRCCKPTAN